MLWTFLFTVPDFKAVVYGQFFLILFACKFKLHLKSNQAGFYVELYNLNLIT
jgi:hypothetical protein